VKHCSIRSVQAVGCLAAAALVLRVAVAQEAFEVASIKAADPHKNPLVLFQAYPGGRMVVTNYTLKMIVMEAYQLGSVVRVTGGSPWIDREIYDITAQPTADSAAAAFRPPAGKDSTFPYPTLQGSAELLSMMRTLLADRFSLKVHRETRQMAVLALKVGKRTPKLEPAHDPSADWVPLGTEDRDEYRNKTMAWLAVMLENHYGRPVLDRTGLTGTYDFHLSYNPRMRDTADSVELPADASGMSLRSALEAQLALLLEEVKAPVEILVIDSASKPSAN
jgi:uncharacterized protein (TIGR03435 family)